MKNLNFSIEFILLIVYVSIVLIYVGRIEWNYILVLRRFPEINRVIFPVDKACKFRRNPILIDFFPFGRRYYSCLFFGCSLLCFCPKYEGKLANRNSRVVVIWKCRTAGFESCYKIGFSSSMKLWISLSAIWKWIISLQYVIKSAI